MAVPPKSKPAPTVAANAATTNATPTSPNVAAMPASSATGDAGTPKAPKSPSLLWGALGPEAGDISPRNRALIRHLKSASSLSALVAALKTDPAFAGEEDRIKKGNVSNHLRDVRKAMEEAGLGSLVPTFGRGKKSVNVQALADLFKAEAV